MSALRREEGTAEAGDEEEGMRRCRAGGFAGAGTRVWSRKRETPDKGDCGNFI